MDNNIFRKKSIDKVQSPEELNDFIKVSNPGIWLIIVAVILLIAGAIIWGIFGQLETVTGAVIYAENGTADVYFGADGAEATEAGQTIRVNIGDETVSGILGEIGGIPVQLDGEADAYILHISGMEAGEWVYEAEAEIDLPDGVYPAEIVTKSESAINLIFN